jgi:hypothetical protein
MRTYRAAMGLRIATVGVLSGFFGLRDTGTPSFSPLTESSRNQATFSSGRLSGGQIRLAFGTISRRQRLAS